MPKALERKLKAEAQKKFPGDKERQDKYVYGTLRKTGWVPSTQKHKKHIPGASEHEIIYTHPPSQIIEIPQKSIEVSPKQQE